MILEPLASIWSVIKKHRVQLSSLIRNNLSGATRFRCLAIYLSRCSVVRWLAGRRLD